MPDELKAANPAPLGLAGLDSLRLCLARSMPDCCLRPFRQSFPWLFRSEVSRRSLPV